jgi:3-oxoacyl-[acyl-carrier-protein] synthase II
VTNDTHDLVYPHPEGRGLQIAMARAMKKARLIPEAVDYLSAHGAAVPRFDLAEARALRKVFGKHSTRIQASAIKSMLGHTQAACGAIEAVTCVKVLSEGIAPPTINLRQPAPECEFDWIPDKARWMKAEVAMSVNFGLGGHNTALIFRRDPEFSSPACNSPYLTNGAAEPPRRTGSGLI